jgi:hypothetical protein
MLPFVAEEPRTPVAVRITRPYASEQEFLSRELETLTRTSVSLLGAPQKPQGVVLRFELALEGGEPLIRGEGRVVGFKAATPGMESALTLRFTRLDARSKALVDRAGALREAKGRPPQAAGSAVEPVPMVRREQTPAPARAASWNATERPRAPPADGEEHGAPDTGPVAPGVPPPPPSSSRTVIAMAPKSASRLDEDRDDGDDHDAPQSAPPTSPELLASPMSPRAATRVPPIVPQHPEHPEPDRRASPPPAERDRLLERLRQRALELKPEAVAAILARPPAKAGGGGAKRKRRGQ